MRRIILSTLAALLLLAAPANASTLQGKYLQACTQANVGQIDPLVNPGGTADHNHAEFGGKAWNSTSTTGDLLSGGTSCFLTPNHSAYWVPTFVASDGTQVPAGSFSTYYGAFGKDTRAIAGGKIQPFPPGLRLIAGNSKSAVIQSTSVQRWRCYDGNKTATYSSPPVSCESSIGGELVFPSCWNGVDLDSPDHRSHMSYSVSVTLSDGSSVRGCPASHPVALPQLDASFGFARPAVGWEGSFLDSDHGVGPRTRTWHGDLWEAQDSIAQAEATKCLNDPGRDSPYSPLCGVFTTATNPWLQPLLAWADKVLYVKSDGNPAAGPS